MGDPDFRRFDDFDGIQRYDPSTKLTAIPTQTEAREMLHADRQEHTETLLNAAKNKNSSKINLLTKIYGTQIGLAIASALISAGLLYWVNPPITQYKRKDTITSEKQDYRKVLVVCSLVLILVFVGPELLSFLRLFEK
jgi:hypothetical protein